MKLSFEQSNLYTSVAIHQCGSTLGKARVHVLSALLSEYYNITHSNIAAAYNVWS